MFCIRQCGRLSRLVSGVTVVTSLALFALALAGVSASAYAGHRHPGHHKPNWHHRSQPEIVVLSNRADLISGGDALVEIKWRKSRGPHHPWKGLSVTLNNKDVEDAFSMREDGRYIGLVTGLRDGKNTLTARDGRDRSKITITNHPITGPIFSGPQIAPYECRTEQNGLGAPLDDDCSAETQIVYYYRNTQNTFVPLDDPANPPDDIAQTTTSDGITVPYIVRVESGTINRGVYRLAMLAAPTDGMDPFVPGAEWNGKLVVSFGGGGSAKYHQGVWPIGTVLSHVELSRGYAYMISTELINHQHANPYLQAETLMMLKEHFIEHIGIPKWTVGFGGSGGAIQQYMIAQLYPGLLDGIQAVASFPETVMPDVWECRLLNTVFQSDPGRWDTDKQVAVQGFNANTCLAWDLAFASIIKSDHVTGCEVLEPENVANIYNPDTNPHGSLRCDFFQTNANLLGTDFRGRALRPIDNVGVQYGLRALNRGDISVAEFLDLNEQVGGFDRDGNQHGARTRADIVALARAYRGGFINSFTGLAEHPVPIITSRFNASLTGDIHDTLQDLIVRARLERATGTSENQIIWTSSSEATSAGVNVLTLSIDLMETWLDDIADDPTPHSIDKVLAHKPADAVDACWDKSGNQIVEPQSRDPNSACNQIYPRFSTPRIEAGEQLTRDVMKCRLKPIRYSDYAVPLSSMEKARLRAIFANGVCNYDLPGIAQVQSRTWTGWTKKGRRGYFAPLDDAPMSRKWDRPHARW